MYRYYTCNNKFGKKWAHSKNLGRLRHLHQTSDVNNKFIKIPFGDSVLTKNVIGCMYGRPAYPLRGVWLQLKSKIIFPF